MASEDTEITLGVGRMIGLFFLLAAICGVFFSIGYSLGKSNAREQALDEPPAQVQPASAAASEQSDAKPPAVVGPKSDAAQAPQEQASAANIKNNLTFYKAVQQGGNSMPGQTSDNAAVPTLPAAAKPAVTNVTQAVTPAMETASPSGMSPINHAAPVTGAGTIVVQIAAITREDDAVALAGALRKKDYNVIVVKNPAVNDKFYHVQVGPFTNMKEADAMKTKLIAEGYNPIVKK
jgi:DedD protein